MEGNKILNSENTGGLAARTAELEELAERHRHQIRALEKAVEVRNSRLNELAKIAGRTRIDMLDEISALRMRSLKAETEWHDIMRRLVEFEEENIRLRERLDPPPGEEQ